MSTDPGPQRQTRHRVPWACRQCRTKKVKCEGGDGRRCARCIDHSLECSGRKGSKEEAQVKALEKRLRQMESILGHRIEGHGSGQTSSSSSLPPSPSSKNTLHLDQDSEEDSEDLHRPIVHDAEPLALRICDNRFHGQSSDIAFLNEVLNIKQSTTRRRQNYAFPFSENLSQALPWEYDYFSEAPQEYSFPEPDLLFSLIDLYFNHLDFHLGLLHRPSFLISVSEGLHLRNSGFAQVVLLVAAVASRYSSDPRVLIDARESTRYSSGWKWYTQAQILSKTFMRPASLYDLQKLVLACVYLFGSSMPTIVWALTSIGLRYAQERGIHCRKRLGRVWTIEDELWKRAFWVLVISNRMSSSVLGSPLCIRVEEYDVELPVTCDEEYWGDQDPEKSFKQPEGLRSKQVYLALEIRLTDVIEFTHRTLYATGKFKAFLAKPNPQWAEDMLQKIDSSLNKWKDAIPKYLRWPASDADRVFYYQSASLDVSYHFARIQAHRQFIPSLIGYSGFSSACLIVCANAARSSSHVFGALASRPLGNNPYTVTIAVSACIFLLLYIWEAEKFGLSIDSTQELQNARLCVDFLKSMEDHFMVAGQFACLMDRLLSQEEMFNAGTFHRSTQSTTSLTLNIDTTPKPQFTSKPLSPILTTGQDQRPTAEHPRSPESFMDLFGAFADETSFGDEPDDMWGSVGNDIAILRSLGTEDEYYRNLFASFGSPQPMGGG